MRCVYVERKEAPLSDMKIHTIYICRNKECSKYKSYSVDKCSVCGNCLQHVKLPADVEIGGS